ncbi:MAG: LysR family transcriptional regulator [Verrucomicrobiae bacterium]|nr:LysR family transcriptional regulator [Verrucomicrobiae bacterium]
MQIETLKVFCDVVRLHSFSRGAAANGVLQSAASQAVQQLEQRLGVRLIDRSRRPWDVTEAGRQFYEGCRDVVDRYYRLEEEIRRTGSTEPALVRVAAIYSVGLGDMNHCIQQFMEQHPNIRVQIAYLHPDEVLLQVLSLEADLGILSFPPARRQLVVVPWRREPMVVVCCRDHPLARFSSVAPAELNGMNFVAFDRELRIRREVDRFLKRHGATVRVVAEFDNVEAIKRAVEVGSAISLLPLPTLSNELRLGTLAKVELAGAEFVRPLGIIYRRGRILPKCVEQFLQRLQELAQAETAP